MSRRHAEQAARIVCSDVPFDVAMPEIVARHRRRGALPRVQVTRCIVALLDGKPVGYAAIGVPCSPKMNPAREVRRVVSWAWGAASALYRAAAEGGASITYTDPDEPGHSLRAAGWRIDRIGPTGPWWGNRPGRAAGPAAGKRVRWRAP